MQHRIILLLISTPTTNNNYNLFQQVLVAVVVFSDAWNIDNNNEVIMIWRPPTA